MPLAVGARLGPYEILSALGAGGMGEVYRARDTTLNRDVAIKVLSDLFASDAERLARFTREAQTLAALNHPNIAHIHGLEQSNGVRALVMELVEGEDLAQRIVRGAFPLDEALPIARQIAEALEAAHEQGIIHRDLKPSNIKVTADGVVKVLDFGLAKLARPEVAGEQADLTAPPTITSPAIVTGVGVLLGTAAYMSPEQAKGRKADKRSDIWAFGCVLYEMLTGQRAFKGDDIADTLAAVLRQDIAWNALPKGTPSAVRRVLQACLQKDHRQRVRDMGDVRLGLDGAFDSADPSVDTAQPQRHPVPYWRRALSWAPTGTLAVALVVALSWGARVRIGSPIAPMRFGIVAPAAQSLPPGPFGHQIAISPDGAHLVYLVGEGPSGSRQTQVMRRAFDHLEAELLLGISNARNPFISPDSQWVGFFAGSAELKKVLMSGGSPIPLCRITGNARGASWGPDDTIIFATSDESTGLMSVPAGGGEPRVLTKPSESRSDHVFPSVLPGGGAVLFTIMPLNTRDTGAELAVLDLKTGQQKTLIRGGRDARYVETGHLVYAAAGTLRAVRFDPVRLEVLSSPVPVVESVEMSINIGGSAAAQYAVSRTGALVYMPGDPAAARTRSLVWVDREGREEAVVAQPRAYHSLRLSPNGDRVALDVRDQEDDIWIWKFADKTLGRLTFNPGNDNYPVWTPDGHRVVFNRAGGGLFSRSADGTGAEDRLTMVPHTQFAMSFSPDGKGLVVTELKTSNDLSFLPMDGKGETVPLVQTMFTEGLGEISPNGRWLAYQSNESSQDEVYVRPFPDVNSGVWQVSPSGGTKPVWARSGRELFFLDGSGALTAVAIQTAPAFSAGNPTRLFDAFYFSAQQGRSYDVSADGQRFLFIKEIPPDPASTSGAIVVVLNWTEELKRLVPTR